MSQNVAGEQYYNPQPAAEFLPSDVDFLNQLGRRAQLDMVDTAEIYGSPDARAAQIVLDAEPEALQAVKREQVAKTLVDRFETKQQDLANFTSEDAAFLSSDPTNKLQEEPEPAPSRNWWANLHRKEGQE